LTSIFRFKEDIEVNPGILINDLKKNGYKVKDDLILKLVTDKNACIGFFEKRVGVFTYTISLRVDKKFQFQWNIF